MKKFAILAIVFSFAASMLAGCPPANNAANKPAPVGNEAPANK